nr:barstar family protein [uncultured Solibaculum sp.]
MKTYHFTVDFTGVKDYDGIYPAIKKGLELPDYWGENLDALWDGLNEMVCDDNRIEIRGVKTLSKSLQDYLEKILDVFRDAEKEHPEYYHITFVD